MSQTRLLALRSIAFGCAVLAFAPGHIASADNIVGTVVAPAREAAGEGAFRHLQALQEIANANNGNRAAGSPGYDRSADYVAARLREAGYAVRFQEFEFP